MTQISSWGRLSHEEHFVVALSDRTQAHASLKKNKPGVAFGMGRSYGDVCLNPGGLLWSTRGMDRFIAFDYMSGRVTCEAGVLLKDVQRLVVPAGWMLPVTPGTQLVSVGGAIANDVHGKNHHVFGSFADHVKRLVLLRTDGELIECGPGLRDDWFSATVGGIGLTGFILTAEIQLRKIDGPWLETETLPYGSIEEFFQIAADSEEKWEYTVSWIDCLSKQGRGLFMRGNHSKISNFEASLARPKKIPVTLPFSLMNRVTLAILNEGYYQLGRLKNVNSTVHYESFFYPLDHVLEWNRLYGQRGFYQYQCLIPKKDGTELLKKILYEISKSGEGSFLAVLKTFGDRTSVGMLGFTGPGVTLALDFSNKGSISEALFRKLDAIVGEAGGRIYLAKDARMPRQLFETGYPSFAKFRRFRDAGISSAASRRLMGY
jgi:FAD/FMN-containing dehydrogenase